MYSSVMQLGDFEPSKIDFHPTCRDGQETRQCSYDGQPFMPWVQFDAVVQFDHVPDNKLVLKVNDDALDQFRALDAHFKQKAPSPDERYNPLVYDHEKFRADVRLHLSKYIRDHADPPDDGRDAPVVYRGAHVTCIARILCWYESPDYGSGYSMKIDRIRVRDVDPETRPPQFLE